jgi:hypothetical protein
MLIWCIIGHYNLFYIDRTSFEYCSPPKLEFPLALPCIGTMRIDMGERIFALY